jgi:hypothetical protein
MASLAHVYVNGVNEGCVAGVKLWSHILCTRLYIQESGQNPSGSTDPSLNTVVPPLLWKQNAKKVTFKKGKKGWIFTKKKLRLVPIFV